MRLYYPIQNHRTDWEDTWVIYDGESPIYRWNPLDVGWGWPIDDCMALCLMYNLDPELDAKRKKI